MGAIYVCDWERDRMQKKKKKGWSIKVSACVCPWIPWICNRRKQSQGNRVSSISTLPANSLTYTDTNAHTETHARVTLGWADYGLAGDAHLAVSYGS